MKPTLKAPESKRLKLEHEKTLSNFAFKFNLRRYNVDIPAAVPKYLVRRCSLTVSTGVESAWNSALKAEI